MHAMCSCGESGIVSSGASTYTCDNAILEERRAQVAMRDCVERSYMRCVQSCYVHCVEVCCNRSAKSCVRYAEDCNLRGLLAYYVRFVRGKLCGLLQVSVQGVLKDVV